MITFRDTTKQAAHYLEINRKCCKHHVEHTGSNVYLLDFYDYLQELEKGKKFVEYLLTLVRDNGEGGMVFYPGHMNPMNMSQNVIDTGAAVDTIARFARRNREAFSKDEHVRIEKVLREVVETYLASAAQDKKITNQRLWGLTGLASYASYTGEKEKYQPIIESSVQRAFKDMTVDGFFRYYPEPSPHLLPYDGITTFYQSRHTAFAHYALELAGVDIEPYRKNMEKNTAALLSMYTSEGFKDMRMECKRWYWLSSYEVASHSFDVYALAFSDIPQAKVALKNSLYQIRNHFYDGYLHSHKGFSINFQCPIFWTAHLAWLTRVPDIEQMFDEVHSLTPFSYEFRGEEVFTQVKKGQRILINTRFQKRNFTTGIIHDGLLRRGEWRLQRPSAPHALFFSIREVINHAWYALRGGALAEAFVRILRLAWELVLMHLPYYSVRYGKIASFVELPSGDIHVRVCPATKYGTLSSGGFREVVIPSSIREGTSRDIT